MSTQHKVFRRLAVISPLVAFALGCNNPNAAPSSGQLRDPLAFAQAYKGHLEKDPFETTDHYDQRLASWKSPKVFPVNADDRGPLSMQYDADATTMTISKVTEDIGGEKVMQVAYEDNSGSNTMSNFMLALAGSPNAGGVSAPNRRLFVGDPNLASSEITIDNLDAKTAKAMLKNPNAFLDVEVSFTPGQRVGIHQEKEQWYLVEATDLKVSVHARKNKDALLAWHAPKQSPDETAKVEAQVDEWIKSGRFVIVWRSEAPDAEIKYTDPDGIEQTVNMPPHSHTGAVSFKLPPKPQQVTLSPQWDGSAPLGRDYKHMIEAYWQGKLINRTGKNGPASSSDLVILSLLNTAPSLPGLEPQDDHLEGTNGH